MRHIASGMLAAILAGAVYASDMATPEEAKAMSLKARAAVNETGRERAFAAFADPDGEFRDRDLYVFCIDMEGVLISQGGIDGGSHQGFQLADQRGETVENRVGSAGQVLEGGCDLVGAQRG